MKLIHAHVLEGLKQIEPGTVQTCVTSPPYWGLRNYGTPPVKWPRMRYKPMAGMRGIVLDCFAGSGTTGMVSIEEGREPILIELLADNLQLIKERCTVTRALPLFEAPAPGEFTPDLFSEPEPATANDPVS